MKATQRLEQRIRDNAVAAVIDLVLDQVFEACIPPSHTPQFDAFHGAVPPLFHAHGAQQQSAPQSREGGSSAATGGKQEQQEGKQRENLQNDVAWEDGQGDGDAELLAWHSKMQRRSLKVSALVFVANCLGCEVFGDNPAQMCSSADSALPCSSMPSWRTDDSAVSCVRRLLLLTNVTS